MSTVHRRLRRVRRRDGRIICCLLITSFSTSGLVALQVLLCFRTVRFCLDHLPMCRRQLRLGLRNGSRTRHSLAARTQVAAGINRSDRHIHFAAAAAACALANAAFAFSTATSKSRGSSSAIGISCLHLLVFVHIDMDHLAGNAGADLDQVPIDLRIIRVFVIGRSATRNQAQPEPAPPRPR